MVTQNQISSIKKHVAILIADKETFNPLYLGNP